MENKTDFGTNPIKKPRKHKFYKIYKEYKAATTREIWEGVRDNFTFGFIGATLVVFIATNDAYHEKIVSNMQEIKARKGRIISIITEGDSISKELSEDAFAIPATDEIIAPLLTVIPLQLLSYYVGTAKGIDVDKPRNLAKSVTVE